MRILDRVQPTIADRPGPAGDRRRLRVLAIILVAVFALAAVFRDPAPPTQAARLAGIAGPGATGIQITNMDPSQSTTVTVDFYAQRGDPPVSRSLPSLAPFQAYSVYLPAEAGLSPGAYSAVISADHEVSTMTHTSWSASTASVRHGDLQSATDQLLPYVAKRYAGQTTMIIIQNPDASVMASATIDVMASGSTTPSASPTFNIGPGRSVSIDVGKMPGFAALQDGFVGWARVNGSVPLVVLAYNDIETSQLGVYAVEGIPEASAAATWVAPLVSSNYYGTSGIVVLNPGSLPVEVGITYTGVAGSCAGQTFEHDDATLGAGTSGVFYQEDIQIPVTGRSHLPSGCAAWARIDASGPVVALANLADVSQGTASAYAPLRPEQAATRLLVPLARRNFFGDTSIQVVNPSSAPASVTLEYADGRGGQGPFAACGSPCQVTIPAGGGHRWDLAGIAGIPDQSYGSARILSDQPILATVYEVTSEDANGQRNGNDSAFNAIAMRASGETAPTRRQVPLALRSHGDPAPSATPGTPRPSPTGSAPQPSATPRSGGNGGMVGAGVTGVQVVNLSRTESADIQLHLQPYAGGTPVTLLRNDVAPGAAANIYLPVEPHLSNGAYAAQVISDQPVDAISRTDWTASGGALLANAAEAASELVIPWVVHEFNRQTSIIGIQNTDADEATTVQVEIWGSGSSAPVASFTVELTAGGASLVDLAIHAGAQGLPEQFSGWARLSASRPIAASSFINLPSSIHGVYEVGAQPAAQAASRLGAPMVFNTFEMEPNGNGGALTSAITVLNPGPDTISATLRYHGAASGGRSNACAGQTIVHNGGAVSIPPRSVQVFYQGDVEIPGSGRSGLPSGCAASAEIEASGGVLAVANVATAGDRGSGAYPVPSMAQSSRRVHLPLVRREHTTGRLTTPFMVQNLGATAATVTLTLRSVTGSTIDCGADCVATIPPGSSRLWMPAAMAAWPSNSYGSALIESDQAIVAAVDDLSLVGSSDQAIYLGLPENDRRDAAIPLLLLVARIGSPPPDPTQPADPTQTPATAGTPRPTATPVPGGVLGLRGASGIMITNLSASESADVAVEFSSQTGGSSVSVTKSGVAAGRTAYIYLPAESALANDVYAARVSADRPVAAVVRNDWSATGHSLLYNAPEASTELLVPVLLKGFFGQTSIISIQNTDGSSATTAELQVMRAGETRPAAQLAISLEAGAATTLSLDSHPAFADLPANSSPHPYWGRVTASKSVAVMTIISGSGPRSAYEVPGIPVGAAASTLRLPMLANAYAVNPDDPAAGKITTGVTLLNPGPDSVTTRIRYQGADTPGRAHACQGLSFEDVDRATYEIGPGASATYYQGNHVGIPENCALSGTIEVTGGAVVGIVTAQNREHESSFTYEPFAGSGAEQVHLPLVRRQHTSVQLETPIQVQNFGDAEASVTLAITDADGQPVAGCTACSASIPPGRSRLWWPSSIPGWSPGSFGSALVTSDQPVGVVAADLSLNGSATDMAAYRGLAAGDGSRTALPLLLNSGRLDNVPPIAGPTPAPSPAPPSVGLPSRMPRAEDGRIAVPLRFDAGDFTVAELDLLLDYDERWLGFDGADADGDGLPDGVDVTLPEDFVVTIEHHPERSSEELSIRVAAPGGPQPSLPNGSWLTIHLEVRGQPETGAGGLRFAAGKGVRARDAAGQEIPARLTGGWSVTSERVAYLPALMK